MKLSVSRDAFLARLGVAARGVSTRSSIQTLSGVRIGEADGGIELQATDMEIGIRVKVEADVESGTQPIVLPGRLLLDVVRSLPNDDLALEYRSQTQDVEIVSGPARFHLRTLPTEDFPKLPEAGDARRISVPAPAFIETVARVGRAASRDEARPHLTGVLVEAGGNELRMVATDSYRLAVKETTLDSSIAGEPFEANVPVRALQELTRIAAADGAAEIEVAKLENQVVFRAGDVVLSSRLIEGRFPNYKQLLPETYEHELRLGRGELLDVVKRISLMAQKNAPLRMRFEDGALEVSAETPDIGEAREALPAPFKGETLEIGFNPEFLQDGLDSAESDELIFKLISPHRPGLIQSGDDGGFIYLVMPVRLNV
ncbi:MAG TPA: DNA polymerase III subunit beta [Thermoleophilaceae bacterium]|nr:DNA polymerase III subunit beta [Thermoleophilaceae bacterium]